MVSREYEQHTILHFISAFRAASEGTLQLVESQGHFALLCCWKYLH